MNIKPEILCTTNLSKQEHDALVEYADQIHKPVEDVIREAVSRFSRACNN